MAAIVEKCLTTSKDVALLRQLTELGELVLAPEYQRQSVWPRAAKAYLIDSILRDRPIPPLFFERRMSAQQGRPVYRVIDGQQRLRAIFDYLSNKFRLTESDGAPWADKRFRDLNPDQQDAILNYDLVVEELSGYTEPEIEDIFARVNRYVVQLTAQEIRNAREHGHFAEFVEDIGRWDFWTRNRVFTPRQLRRFRAVEFAAELTILLSQGPQDKKKSIDICMRSIETRFQKATSFASAYGSISIGLANTTDPRDNKIPKSVDLYSLIGALDNASDQGANLGSIDKQAAGVELLKFDRLTRRDRPPKEVSRYLVAASRQTDNIIPRSTRIAILEQLLTPS